jgi:hypothetical protein
MLSLPRWRWNLQVRVPQASCGAGRQASTNVKSCFRSLRKPKTRWRHLAPAERLAWPSSLMPCFVTRRLAGQVAMRDALAVCRIQRVQNLPRVFDGLRQRQRALERRALDEFHHQVVKRSTSCSTGAAVRHGRRMLTENSEKHTTEDRVSAMRAFASGRPDLFVGRIFDF